MNHAPAVVSAITSIGTIAFIALTAVALHRAATKAGESRALARTLAATSAVLLTAWTALLTVLASHGVFHARLGHGVPWLPIATATALGVLLALSRLTPVARVLSHPGAQGELVLPHSGRVEGIAFLLMMATGHLPALFAIPAGLGDLTTGLTAPLVARRIAQGRGRRSLRWLNLFGLSDLVVALSLGAAVGFQLISTTPDGSAISSLPLVLIPTAIVPVLLALHVSSLRWLRASRTSAPRPRGTRDAIAAA